MFLKPRFVRTLGAQGSSDVSKNKLTRYFNQLFFALWFFNELIE